MKDQITKKALVAWACCVLNTGFAWVACWHWLGPWPASVAVTLGMFVLCAINYADAIRRL